MQRKRPQARSTHWPQRPQDPATHTVGCNGPEQRGLTWPRTCSAVTTRSSDRSMSCQRQTRQYVRIVSRRIRYSPSTLSEASLRALSRTHRSLHTSANFFAYEPYVLHSARPRYTRVKTSGILRIRYRFALWPGFSLPHPTPTRLSPFQGTPCWHGDALSRRRRPCRMHLHRQRRAHSNTGKRMARRCHRSGRSPPPEDPEEASFQAELEVRLASLGRQSGCLGTVSSNIEMLSSTQSLGLPIASKDLLFTASNHLARVILHSRFLAMSFAFAFSFSTYPPSCFSRCRLSSPMCWYAAPQPQCGRTRLGLLSAQGEAHPTPSTHAPMVYDWVHRWQDHWLHQVRNWHYLSGGGGGSRCRYT